MTSTIKSSALHGRIDFLVVTILHEEYTAVLRHFAPTQPVYGDSLIYEYREVENANGQTARIAIVRTVGQGHSRAQGVAYRAIDELAPRWIILTGIAGGVVDRDYTLGDVLIASSIHDFAVTAAIENEPPKFRTGGGSVHRDVERLLGNLPAWENRLGEWNSVPCLEREKPAMAIPDDINDGHFYGADEMRQLVRDVLLTHFPASGAIRFPRFYIGALATSNMLVKDTNVIEHWRDAARHITHLEMEAGGVYEAVRNAQRHEIPFLSIRGISDVVGFKRSAEWTPFACDVAASFLHALLTLQPLEAFAILPDGGTAESESESRPPATPTPTVEEINAAFAKSSKPLLSRVVDANDRIPRPEISEVQADFSTDSGRVLCVLGSPGSGKTAFLALVARQAAADGIATLALKADLLPTDSPFDSWGRRELGADISAIDAVRVAASRGRVLVMVDQLDALGSIVAISSNLFNLVIEFIRACAGVPNVSVVCSCRSLDYYQDARFATLDAKTIELALPPWEEVTKQLGKHGIAGADNWSSEFREILRTPQHLKVFLDRFASTGRTDVHKSYHLMLDDLWTRSALTEVERAFLDSLTQYMMAHEVLWAPTAAFEGSLPTIESLKGKGLLESEDLKVGFRHQTLLEHSKARFFTKTEISFSEYVLSHQTTLEVRPTVWSVLEYLRSARPEKYRTEIERLFQSQPRLHLRYLLIDFLGQCSSPHDFEKSLLGGRLADTSDRTRALLSIIGRREWFDAFRITLLPMVMQGDTKYQWPMIGVLKAAWDFDHDACFDLINRNWFPEPAKDGLTHRVLSETDRWGDRELELACALIRRATDDDNRLFWAEQLVYVVSASRPEMAPRLFVETATRFQQRSDERNPLEHSQSWYELPGVAEAAPIDFLRAAWGWLVATCEANYPGHQSTVLYQYAGSSGSLDERSRRERSPVMAAFLSAIDAGSAATPTAFVEITRPSWASENAVVHRLISRGLAIVVKTLPQIGMEYLSGDRRRLQVGSYQSERRSDSKRLISEMAPKLSFDDLRRLEAMILRWTQYREDQKLGEDQLKWDREDRLHLLTAIPAELLAADLIEFVEAEKTAFPSWERVAPEPKSGSVRQIPPISKEEMIAASEDDIAKVILRTPDVPYGDRTRTEVQGGWEVEGGPEAAGRVLTELVKDDPHKVVGVITRMVAGGMEDAATGPFQLLAESALSDSEIISFARTLVALNPLSRRLRHQIGYILYRRAKRPNGIPDDLCTALSGWLDDMAPTQGEEEQSELEEDASADRESSVLWGHAGTLGLHTIDYPFWLLLALTEGYLRRTQPDTSRWLNEIEKCLVANFSVRTWLRYCGHLASIRCVEDDQPRGVKLVLDLLAKFPILLRHSEGVHLVANTSDLLPQNELQRVLRQLRQEDRPVLRQAYGELLTLVAFRDEMHVWARDLLESELAAATGPQESDDEIERGIAYAAANLWEEPRAREDSSKVLSRLISVANKATGRAISTVFWAREDFPADQHTEVLLRTLADNPAGLAHIPIRDLVGHMVSLVTFQRELILSLCETILESRGTENELFEMGPDLVKISMTLQRFTETREGALEFFERLLHLGLDAAFQVLQDIDIRPASNSTPPRRERRRRRRGPRSNE